jgi:hypothetical protein
MKRKATSSPSTETNGFTAPDVRYGISSIEPHVTLDKLRSWNEKCSSLGGLPTELLDSGGYLGLRWYKKDKTKQDVINNIDDLVIDSDDPLSAEVEDKEKISDKCPPKNLTLDDLCWFVEDDVEEEKMTKTKAKKPENTKDNVRDKNENEYTCSLFKPANVRNGVKENRDDFAPGCKVICRQIASSGAREYAIVWWPDFLPRMMKNCTGAERTFNELVEENEPCKLYLDLDIELASLPPELLPMVGGGIDEGTLIRENVERKQKILWAWTDARTKLKASLDEFCARVISELCKVFGLQACGRRSCYVERSGSYEHSRDCIEKSEIRWLVLDSSNMEKFSKHIVFTLFENECLFENKAQVGYFIAHCAKVWRAEIESNDQPLKIPKLANGDGVSSIEEGEIKNDENNKLSNAKESKTKENSLPINNKTKWNIYWRYGPRTSSSLSSSTELDARLVLLDWLDFSVYQGEKEFRMVESNKFGENRPMLVEWRNSVKLREPGCFESKGVPPSSLQLKVSSRSIKKDMCLLCTTWKNKIRTNLYWKPNNITSSDAGCNSKRGNSDDDDIDDELSFFYDEDEADEQQSSTKNSEGSGKNNAAEIQPEVFTKEPEPKRSPVILSFVETTHHLALEQNCLGTSSDGIDFSQCFYDSLVLPCWDYRKTTGARSCDFGHAVGCSELPKKLNLLWFCDDAAERERFKNSLMAKRSKILTKMATCKSEETIALMRDKLAALSVAGNRAGKKRNGKNPKSRKTAGPDFGAHFASKYYNASFRGASGREIDGNPSSDTAFGEGVSHDGMISGEKLRDLLTLKPEPGTNAIEDGVDDPRPEGELGKAESILRTMGHYGDDPLGKNLIAAIAANIEEDTGMNLEGQKLKYKNECVIEDGTHFICFETHHTYKKCWLKMQRCGMENGKHSGNNVWFSVCLNSFVYWQKCHSQTCREYYARDLAKTIGDEDDAGSIADGEEENNDRQPKLKSSMAYARGPTCRLRPDLEPRILNFLRLNDALDQWDELCERTVVAK